MRGLKIDTKFNHDLKRIEKKIIFAILKWKMNREKCTNTDAHSSPTMENKKST